MSGENRGFDRRRLVTAVGLILSARGIAAQPRSKRLLSVGASDVRAAARLAGVELSYSDARELLPAIRAQNESLQRIREETQQQGSAELPLRYQPPLPVEQTVELRRTRWSRRKEWLPDDFDELAFLPLTRVGRLLAQRDLTAVRLSEALLARIAQLDERLAAGLSVNSRLALRRARAADRVLDGGPDDASPLVGIPWVDSLSLGSRERTGAVAALGELGAVPLGTIETGLARDVREGQPKNPWREREDVPGDSAGAATAVAAGYVPFALTVDGSGSMFESCRSCGVTALKPTFGTLPTGGATRCSTLDTVGIVARSAEDCGVLFEQLRSHADGRRPPAPGFWEKWSEVRIGLFRDQLVGSRDNLTGGRARVRALEIMARLELRIEPVQFSRSDVSDLLEVLVAVEQEESQHPPGAQVMAPGTWVTASDYLSAQRLRGLISQELDRLFDGVEILALAAESPLVHLARLTGHPALLLPIGVDGQGLPEGMALVARAGDERRLIGVAQAFQEATVFHLRKPKIGLQRL